MSAQASTLGGLSPLDAIVGHLREWVRSLDSRVAARRNARVVATRVGLNAAPAEVLSVYLGSIPFTNGDAWEALR
jgi:hypothetical protein